LKRRGREEIELFRRNQLSEFVTRISFLTFFFFVPSPLSFIISYFFFIFRFVFVFHFFLISFFLFHMVLFSPSGIIIQYFKESMNTLFNLSLTFTQEHLSHIHTTLQRFSHGKHTNSHYIFILLMF